MQRLARRGPGEEGASLVEFALIAPVFLTLLLGMLTGGIAFDRKLGITAAAREAARYGATLPLSAHSGNVDAWLADVASAAGDAADGQLAPDTSGRVICVAYVSSTVVRRLEEIGASSALTDQACFDDSRPATETRVQVVTKRTSTLQTIVWQRELQLQADAVARFEASP